MVARIGILKIKNKVRWTKYENIKNDVLNNGLECTVKGSNPTPFQFVSVRLGVKYYSHKKPMSTHFPNAGKGTGHWCQKTTSG